MSHPRVEEYVTDVLPFGVLIVAYLLIVAKSVINLMIILMRMGLSTVRHILLFYVEQRR